MSIWSNLSSTLAENWANWAFTTVVTLFGAYVGIRYQSRKQASIDEKEREQAKDEILNMMEDRLINEKEISEKWVSNLLSASERKNDLRTLSQTSSISLLQELMYEIEESSHLDPDQKERYVGLIQDTIENLEDKKRMSSISDSYSNVIEKLRKEIDDENDSALKALRRLENKVVKHPPEKWGKNIESTWEDTVTAAIAGAGLFMLVSSLAIDFFIKDTSGLFNSLFSFDPFMIALLPFVLFILIIRMRLKNY